MRTITLTLPYPISAPGVYRITDAKSGKFYVGSSINMKKRWSTHRRRLVLGNHPNPALQAIWNADPARLSIETIAGAAADRDAILEAEQIALDAAAVGTNRLCMNVLAVAGSHLGRKRSAQTRQALAAAQRGKTHTPQARERMRAAKLGKPLSAEHRAKLSAASLGRKLPSRRGEQRPSLRRFSDSQVRAMRSAKSSGASYAELQARFGVSRGALQRLIARETYAEVV